MSKELRRGPSQPLSSRAVLHAFLKDGHYNHSPQFHPMARFCESIQNWVKGTAGIAGVPPAMSAKREQFCQRCNSETCAPAARCGRDARDPSKPLMGFREQLNQLVFDREYAEASRENAERLPVSG